MGLLGMGMAGGCGAEIGLRGAGCGTNQKGGMVSKPGQLIFWIESEK